MPSPAPCNAFTHYASPAALARINRYSAYRMTPMGRLEAWLDQLAYDQMCRTAWGIPVTERIDHQELTNTK